MIWGIEDEYQQIFNQLQFETMKGNLEVVALCCRKEDICCKTYDGYPIVCKDDLVDIDFDHIIICNKVSYKAIEQDANWVINQKKLKVLDKKIYLIHGEVFNIPYFDFGRYESLIVNPVTIISDDCWALQIYKYLKLPYSSPTIGLFWKYKDYLKLIQDPIGFLKYGVLTKDQDVNLFTNQYAIGRLTYKDDTLFPVFNHSIGFDLTYAKWQRRKNRSNFNNIFIKMSHTIYSRDFNCNVDFDEQFIAFDKCNYPKFIINAQSDTDKSYFRPKFYVKNCLKYKNHIPLDSYIRDKSNNEIDILRLLTDKSIKNALR